MSGTVDQRFAPPEAHVEDLAPVGTTPLAGRLVRLLAALIDSALMWVVIWAVMHIPGLAALIKEPDGFTSWNFGSMIVGVIVFLVLQAAPLVRRGQTLGKMACRIRIVRSDGTPADAVRVLGLRYGIGFLMGCNVASSAIFGVVDSLLIFRGSRKCLHDSIADTKVIKL